MLESKFDEAVRDLGKSFGLISRDAFVSALILKDKSINSSGLSPQTVPPAEQIIKKFLGMTEGANFTKDVISDIQSLFKGEKNSASAIKKINKNFVITYEAIPGAKYGLNNGKDLVGSSQLQGRDAKGKPFSIKETVGVKGESTINAIPTAPTKENPALSAVQVFHQKYSVANRDANAIALFLNAIPTIEFSKCVPMLELTIITDDSNRSSKDGEQTIQSTSQLRFLLGKRSVKANTVNGELASAQRANIIGKGKKKNNIAVAGMELFTSPQTLVSADESYESVSSDVGSQHTGRGKRSASVIDKFQPLATLKQVSFTVIPTAGMMSYKSGKISLTIHDRSRLSELASFVKPDLFGGTELLIEYGWNHPESGPASVNSFATFLAEMKVAEKYKVINHSFQLNDSGGIDVELDIAMNGSSDITTTMISEGNSLKDVKDLKRAISLAQKKISKLKKGSGDVSPESFLSSLSDTTSALSVDEKTRKKIHKFIVRNRNGTTDLRELVGHLETIYGKKRDGSGGLQADIKKSISQSIGKLVGNIEHTPDPFLEVSNLKNIGISSTKDFVSFGKLALAFIGKPLAETKRYNEVQMIFHPFNMKAARMHNKNIAQFPISASEFRSDFASSFKLTSNIPIRDFIQFMNRNYLSNQAAQAFGLQDLYRKDASTGKYVRKGTDKKKATRLFTEKQKKLQDAYGKGQKVDLTFKPPRIQMIVETLKIDGDDDKTILRIQFFDKQCTTYESLTKMLNQSRDGQINALKMENGKIETSHKEAFVTQIQKALKFNLIEPIPKTTTTKSSLLNFKGYFRIKGGFPAVKSFISQTMPSVIFSSQNSAIFRPTLRSMQNPQLSTVNMLRAGVGNGLTPQGVNDAGLPLRISPMELELTTIGCPLFNFGQQIFFDFGTGTTADNIYAVVGFTHKISNSGFETSVKLVLLDAYGKYESLLDTVQQALTAINLPPKT